MFKKIIRAIYFAFISILLISFFLAGWTSYALVSQSSKSNEIMNVIHDIYSSQKSVVIDFIDLSKILIKDVSKNVTEEKNNIAVETERMNDLLTDSPLDESLITEDNPLGIVIKPSLDDVREMDRLETSQESLVEKENELSTNKIEMQMRMDMD